MAVVSFIGGPLNGRGVEIPDEMVSLNVLDDARLGLVRLVTYRVDPASGTARVVAESDL